MQKYNLVFIKKRNNILMLKRKNKPFIGIWNGLGGKIKSNESPIESVVREIREEAGIKLKKEDCCFRGLMTTDMNGYENNLIFLFLVDLEKDYEIKKGLICDEGILEMKKIDWILDKNNKSVVPNIPFFLEDILNENLIHVHCEFKNNILLKVNVDKM